MSAVSSWDTTAANNNSASPDGFPESMAPSGLNDSAREVMASIASWLLEFRIGADVASASELPVNVAGMFHDVTGTTSITSLAAATNDTSKLKVLQFDGALTLTHHATDLILPGGANITTAAGDIGIFYEYAAGDWRCVSYQRALDVPNKVCRIATGSYTGDGTTSQAITGIGFQPKYVKVAEQRTSDGANGPVHETWDTVIDDNAEGIAFLHAAGGAHTAETNKIISLDSDGFTVDDNGSDDDPNANGTVYNYLALG